MTEKLNLIEIPIAYFCPGNFILQMLMTEIEKIMF